MLVGNPSLEQASFRPVAQVLPTKLSHRHLLWI